MRLLGLLLSCALVACNTDRSDYVPLGGDGTDVRTVAIDTDAKLAADAQKGIGLMVEYAAGGSWTLKTTCDTLLQKDPNYFCDGGPCPCVWDIVASLQSPDADLVVTDGSGLQSADDSIVDVDHGAKRLLISTSDEVDSVKLLGDPGGSLAIDVYWGSGPDLVLYHDPSYVNWVEGGIVSSGAPSDPTIFTPTTP